MPDEDDCRAQVAALTREAAALENCFPPAQRPQRPALDETDLLACLDTLQAHVDGMRVSLRSAPTNRMAASFAGAVANAPAPAPAPASQFADTAAQRRELESELAASESALAYYCAKLGRRPSVCRPANATADTLREYKAALHRELVAAHNDCLARGLTKPANAPRPTAPKPAGRKLTATEKCLAAKSAK